MAHSMLVLRIAVCLLLTAAVTHSVDNSKSNLIDLGRRVIETFFSQARTNRTTGRPERQFATLILTDSTADDLTYLARARDDNGNWYAVEQEQLTDSSQQCYPPTADHAINYMVARPNTPEGQVK